MGAVRKFPLRNPDNDDIIVYRVTLNLNTTSTRRLNPR